MARTRYTWEYNPGGCPTCNVTGQIVRECPTWWNTTVHDRSGCNCDRGRFYTTCHSCKGRGYR